MYFVMTRKARLEPRTLYQADYLEFNDMLESDLNSEFIAALGTLRPRVTRGLITDRSISYNAKLSFLKLTSESSFSKRPLTSHTLS